MKELSIAIAMLGLCYFGFEHDSGWCFAGAVICFFGLTG